jgi:hypothetical protein
MNEFPNDVIYEICGHLLPHELVAITEVNKKYNTFVGLQWNNLNTYDNKIYLIRRYIKVVLSSLPMEEVLKAIDMSHCKPETQERIKSKFTRMYEKVMQAYEPEMFNMFDYDELTLLVKFTCSPAGSNILTKQARSQQAILPILSNAINKTLGKIHQIVEDEKPKDDSLFFNMMTNDDNDLLNIENNNDDYMVDY